MNWIGKLAQRLVLCLMFAFFLINAEEMLRQVQHERNKEISSSPLVLSSSKDSSGKSHPHVRVLLQEFDTAGPISFTLNCADGFYLIDATAKKKTAYADKIIAITCAQNKWYLNKKLIDKASFYLKPQQGYISFEGKSYQGTFLIIVDKRCAYVINLLNIEDYVCSVLRTESWPGWPLEVNKAFAICSRSYVIGVVLNHITSKVPYHIKNTNRHQTYSGVHNDPVLQQAVQETQGMYLTHDGKPMVAMFDACCGGVIPALIQGVNFTHAPYLARPYACKFCTNARGYNWSAVYSFKQFEKILQPEFPKVKDIKEIKNYKVDKAGTVQSIQIKTAAHTFHIPVKKLYYLLPKVRSFYFDTKTKQGKIIFTGHGIGHHLGLCQWGAREMVARGYTYKQILDFYYPGTQLMHVE